MWLSHTLLLTIAFTIYPQAQGSDLSNCVQSCLPDIQSAWCTGDEEGVELEKCKCQRIATGGEVPCIKDSCPKSDQAAYAATVPEYCRDSLFPNITVTATPTPTSTQDSSAGAEATTSAGGSPSSTNAAGVVAQTPIAVVGGLLAAMLV